MCFMITRSLGTASIEVYEVRGTQGGSGVSGCWDQEGLGAEREKVVREEEKGAWKLRVLRTTSWDRDHSTNSGLQRYLPSLKTPLTEKHSNVL